MSAGLNGIGPVSVRYSVQIRELLHTQSIKRMVAEQEAVRAQTAARVKAARAESLEAFRSTLGLKDTSTDSVKVDVKTDIETAPAEPAEPAPKPTAEAATGQFVDELA